MISQQNNLHRIYTQKEKTENQNISCLKDDEQKKQERQHLLDDEDMRSFSIQSTPTAIFKKTSILDNDDKQHYLRIGIVQYETRTTDTFLNTMMQEIKEYSEKNGYHYFRGGLNNDLTDICPYYAKVFCVYRYMMENKHKLDYIMFLDSDCFIYDKEVGLETIIRTIFFADDDKKEKEYCLAVTEHPYNKSSHAVNAGHYILKMNEKAFQLMKDWVDLYCPSCWTRHENGRWMCIQPNGQRCLWSGQYYEQGDLHLFLLPTFEQYIYFDTQNKLFANCDTIDFQRQNSLMPYVVHLCSYLKTPEQKKRVLSYYEKQRRK